MMIEKNIKTYKTDKLILYSPFHIEFFYFKKNEDIIFRRDEKHINNFYLCSYEFYIIS